MLTTLQTLVRRHTADVAMVVITLVWGFHYIVMKQGVADVPPITYNALRFLIGAPIILAILLRRRGSHRLTRQDMGALVYTTLLGSVLYQVCFSLGIKHTTGTNTALLVSTLPAWTALMSVFMGLVIVRKRMLIGLAITFGGVVLVIFSGSGDGLRLSHGDLVGSGLLIFGAIVSAYGTILTKPLIDRLGGLSVAVWSYLMTTVGLLALAGPDLLNVSIPLRAWPYVLYSGLLSSVAGFLVWNYALGAIGPTRATTYHNFTPIVAALSGILVLGEPFTLGLAIGGCLTLWGVVVVRRNTFIRPPDALLDRAVDPVEDAPAPAPIPAVRR